MQNFVLPWKKEIVVDTSEERLRLALNSIIDSYQKEFVDEHAIAGSLNLPKVRNTLCSPLGYE
jgi:hypothetical protein